jgi:hypothetical protein
VRSRTWLLLAGLLVAVAVGGCTKSEAGQAQPGNDGTSEAPPTSTSGGAPSSVTIPPRPKELRLDGVDPCALFTQPQLAQLSVKRTRARTSGSEHFKGMKECVLEVRAEQFYDFSVMAATNEGIAPWLAGDRNVEAKLTSVAGYAAATYWFRGASGTKTADCTTSVDVADGQQLTVNVENDGGHSFTLEQLCQRAENAAALAMQTLQTLK